MRLNFAVQILNSDLSARYKINKDKCLLELREDICIFRGDAIGLDTTGFQLFTSICLYLSYLPFSLPVIPSYSFELFFSFCHFHLFPLHEKWTVNCACTNLCSNKFLPLCSDIFFNLNFLKSWYLYLLKTQNIQKNMTFRIKKNPIWDCSQ